MDQDTMPDICDNDIDGDGVNNMLGLVQFENTNCSLTWNNTNPTLIANYEPWSDNCPFIINNNQNNSDQDSYGDACDPAPNTPSTNNNLDTDNDGVPNYLDNLPLIPISPTSIILSTTSVTNNESQIINNCTSCPCGFTQTLSPIAQGDIVYSTMEYEGGVIKSNLFPVK